MNLKRTLTTLIGIPVIGAILGFANNYIIGALLTITAIICMYEYYKVIEKVAHPIKWIGYICTLIIAIAAFIEIDIFLKISLFTIPFIMLILFLHIIISNMKFTFKDIAYTFLGICYITFFIVFLSLIRNLENGKALLGYIFIIAWSTDIFAYVIGKHFGKHFFSKISPKKTVEGCTAGVIGAVIMGLVYLFISNKFFGTNIDNYIVVGVITAILSIISQIGDFVASSIKRFVEIKDYGDLIPGHGGMLDRIDSLIFIAPFAYLIFSILL